MAHSHYHLNSRARRDRGGDLVQPSTKSKTGLEIRTGNQVMKSIASLFLFKLLVLVWGSVWFMMTLALFPLLINAVMSYTEGDPSSAPFMGNALGWVLWHWLLVFIGFWWWWWNRYLPWKPSLKQDQHSGSD